MPHFHDSFVEQPHYIEPNEMPPEQQEPFVELDRKGFVVVAGLRRSDVPEITEIAGQPGTREFCPRDLTERWGSEEMIEAQLARKPRGVIRLEHQKSQQTAGFGWTGYADEKERKYTGASITFAIRINEQFGGNGLATPFTRAIVYSSRKFFGATAIGWETWASNNKAVNAYIRAGAALTRAVNSKRPTLDTTFPVATEGDHVGKHIRPDTRLYMRAPESF